MARWYLLIILACTLVLLCPRVLVKAQSTDSFPVHNISTGLNYATIQSAINAIQTVDGNIIRVDPGTYNETLLLRKGVSLMGDTPYDTIVNGQVAISKSNVSLTDFGLSGEVLINDDIQTIQISQNVILGGVEIGEAVSYCTISKNNITGSGISCGDAVSGADHSAIEDNLIENCYLGISISSCSLCTIEQNDIYNNTIGVSIFRTENCLVTENSIHNNYVGISGFDTGSSNNTIYLNNFFDNNKQAESQGGASYWDNGKEGNYWDDYNGTDRGDGIGSNPYVIDSYNQDNFPLMKPYNVVPDFPSFLVLWILILVTLLAVIFYKKAHFGLRTSGILKLDERKEGYSLHLR